MKFREIVYVLVLIDRKPPYRESPREFLLETEGQGREGVSQVAAFSILFLNKEDWPVWGSLPLTVILLVRPTAVLNLGLSAHSCSRYFPGSVEVIFVTSEEREQT